MVREAKTLAVAEQIPSVRELKLGMTIFLIISRVDVAEQIPSVRELKLFNC